VFDEKQLKYSFHIDLLETFVQYKEKIKT